MVVEHWINRIGENPYTDNEVYHNVFLPGDPAIHRQQNARLCCRIEGSSREDCLDKFFAHIGKGTLLHFDLDPSPRVG